MNKALLAGTVLLASFTVAKDNSWFSGRIVYHNTFKTLAGQDITDKLAPILGSETFYYINNNKYKSYTEQKQLVQLYDGDDNVYRPFMRGQAMPVMEASKASYEVEITPLKEQATILGYTCHSLQVTGDGSTTVYYYSPKVRVDAEKFSKHQLGNWYAYLKASGGALPLRFIITNTKQGYIWTSEATAVQDMPLTAADFTVDAPAR